MDFLDDFHWDRSLPDLRVLRQVKGGPDSGRRVYQASAGGALLALKVHRLGSLRKKWRARAGDSLLSNELNMLRQAAAASLPVPAALSYGHRRVIGLVTHEALLMTWIDGKQSLRAIVADAVAVQNDAAVNRAIDLLVAMLARIRAAGIADRDYAFGQVLVNPAAADWDPTWLDLEAAFPAAPDEPAGTGATAGMALAGVWNATGGREASLRHAWDLIRQTVPVPAGGWSAATGEVERALRFGVEKGMRRGRIHAMPPPLT